MAYRRELFGSGLLTFDIFRGHYRDNEAVWVEAVEGLGSARERMQQIATETPGAYFIFCTGDGLVLDIVDTTRVKHSTQATVKASAP